MDYSIEFEAHQLLDFLAWPNFAVQVALLCCQAPQHTVALGSGNASAARCNPRETQQQPSSNQAATMIPPSTVNQAQAWTKQTYTNHQPSTHGISTFSSRPEFARERVTVMMPIPVSNIDNQYSWNSLLVNICRCAQHVNLQKIPRWESCCRYYISSAALFRMTKLGAPPGHEKQPLGERPLWDVWDITTSYWWRMPSGSPSIWSFGHVQWSSSWTHSKYQCQPWIPSS